MYIEKNETVRNYISYACGEPFDTKFEKIFKLADTVNTTSDAAKLMRTCDESMICKLRSALDGKRRFRMSALALNGLLLSTQASLLVCVNFNCGTPERVADFDPLVVENGKRLYAGDFKHVCMRMRKGAGRMKVGGAFSVCDRLTGFAHDHPAFTLKSIIAEEFAKYVKMDAIDPENCAMLIAAGMSSRELRRIGTPISTIQKAEITCKVSKDQRLKCVRRGWVPEDVTVQVTA